jgi:hypothetical protein
MSNALAFSADLIIRGAIATRVIQATLSAQGLLLLCS